jgi:hypothetical protein
MKSGGVCLGAALCCVTWYRLYKNNVEDYRPKHLPATVCPPGAGWTRHGAVRQGSRGQRLPRTLHGLAFLMPL